MKIIMIKNIPELNPVNDMILSVESFIKDKCKDFEGIGMYADAWIVDQPNDSIEDKLVMFSSLANWTKHVSASSNIVDKVNAFVFESSIKNSYYVFFIGSGENPYYDLSLRISRILSTAIKDLCGEIFSNYKT